MRKSLIFSFSISISVVILLFVLGSGLVFPLTVAAQDYVPLAPIPGVAEGSDVTIESYVKDIFVLIVSLSTVLAVLLITIGGLQYMTAGDNPGKVTAAKERIKGAVMGLLLISAAWLIIYTINPDILGLGFLENTQPGAYSQDPSEIQIEEVVFNDAFRGEEYRNDLSPGVVFSHPVSEYDAEIADGEIPPGLSFESTSTGVRLIGTPTEVGEFTFTIKIEDNSGQEFEFNETIEIFEPQVHDPDGPKSLTRYDGAFEPALGPKIYRRIHQPGSFFGGSTTYVYGPYNTIEECERYEYGHRDDIHEQMENRYNETNVNNDSICWDYD
ncbi:MAG: putative Ig domain-containing protein [Candidatus Paceibacterota bacterium]